MTPEEQERRKKLLHTIGTSITNILLKFDLRVLATEPHRRQPPCVHRHC